MDEKKREAMLRRQYDELRRWPLPALLVLVRELRSAIYSAEEIEIMVSVANFVIHRRTTPDKN